MVHDSKLGSITGYVVDKDTGNPIVDAAVTLHSSDVTKKVQYSPAVLLTDKTGDKGEFSFENLAHGPYWLVCGAFRPDSPANAQVTVKPGQTVSKKLEIDVGLTLTSMVPNPDNTHYDVSDHVVAGTPVTIRAEHKATSKTKVDWRSDQGAAVKVPGEDFDALLRTDNLFGKISVACTLSEIGSPALTVSTSVNVFAATPQPISGQIGVTLKRTDVPPTPDMGLWSAIRTHAKAVSFGGLAVKGVAGRSPRGYQGFIDKVLCKGEAVSGTPHEGTLCPPTDVSELPTGGPPKLPLHGMAAYELLKTATEIFLLLNCGVAVRKTDILNNPITSDEEEILRSGLSVANLTARLAAYLGSGRLPYIQRVVETAFPGEIVDGAFCSGVLTSRADCACLIELIWSYWHEEGMLAQSLNTISRRFQNVRGPGERDPLAHLEIDPLRPLNNLLWGYVQDEQNRLTVKRRAYEYDHHYGLTLYGKAIPALRPADSRSKFLEGFHNLLHLTSIFYKEDNDTTVIADGFPLLNALKEVHLLLAQGAHNQFGDLPWTARAEMLVQQWLLARPEMRDFLMSRPMVPYQEAWMPQVDTMKTLQGWSDVTITHFRDLAVYGEQILLSIRYGDWIDINIEDFAKNWARYWRPEVQGYLHAYRAVTGVDLTNPDTVDYAMPALHLKKRLALQRVR